VTINLAELSSERLLMLLCSRTIYIHPDCNEVNSSIIFSRVISDSTLYIIYRVSQIE